MRFRNIIFSGFTLFTLSNPSNAQDVDCDVWESKLGDYDCNGFCQLDQGYEKNTRGYMACMSNCALNVKTCAEQAAGIKSINKPDKKLSFSQKMKANPEYAKKWLKFTEEKMNMYKAALSDKNYKSERRADIMRRLYEVYRERSYYFRIIGNKEKAKKYKETGLNLFKTLVNEHSNYICSHYKKQDNPHTWIGDTIWLSKRDTIELNSSLKFIQGDIQILDKKLNKEKNNWSEDNHKNCKQALSVLKLKEQALVKFLNLNSTK